MKKGDLTLKITTRSKDATTLIRASAVRDGNNGGKCVYLAQQTESALGGVHLVVKEFPVTVLASNEEWVSVQEDLSYSIVVYQEDRFIQDGDSIMMYSK